VIAGYRLDGYVGQGSRAVVYLAQDERLHRQVALKVMMPELARDPGFRTRMISESRAAAALGHPHIVPVFEADETDGTLYAAMRYVTGGDAGSLLGRHGPLPLGYAWRIVAQIASALDAVHAHGLMHRDVRPANILVDGDAAGGRAAGSHAFLSDFGMSKVFPSGQVIEADQAAGILDYLPPEQIEGRDVDARADQYSLACAGFELLCGMPPFGPDQGQTLMYAQIYADPPAASARRAGIPAAADSVLATALAKDPADRYPSCGRFAEELRAALGLRPGQSADPPRSAAPRGVGPGSGPRPAPAAGRRLLRVERRPPSAEDRRPAAKEPPAAAKELPTAAKERPAAAIELPAAANKPPATAPDLPAEPGPQAPATAGDPGGPDPEPSARRLPARGPVLAAGAVVVVAAAVVSGVVLSGRSAPASAPAASTPAPAASSPSPSPASPSATSSPPGPVTASQQAAALSTLLTSSAVARTALHNAVTQVGACTNLSGAISQLQAVVNQRAAQYGRASALPITALPGGAQVKSKLMTALGSSLTADRDYLSWARQQETGGCTPTSQSSDYNAAFNASQRADAAKLAFVQVWNPVAARYGIAQKSPRDI
jgi:serine/threonine-protein kinase